MSHALSTRLHRLAWPLALSLAIVLAGSAWLTTATADEQAPPSQRPALAPAGDWVAVGPLRLTREECVTAAGPRAGRHRDEVVQRLRELRPRATADLTDAELLKLVPSVVRGMTVRNGHTTPARSTIQRAPALPPASEMLQ